MSMQARIVGWSISLVGCGVLLAALSGCATTPQKAYAGAERDAAETAQYIPTNATQSPLKAELTLKTATESLDGNPLAKDDDEKAQNLAKQHPLIILPGPHVAVISVLALYSYWDASTVGPQFHVSTMLSPASYEVEFEAKPGYDYFPVLDETVARPHDTDRLCVAAVPKEQAGPHVLALKSTPKDVVVCSAAPILRDDRYHIRRCWTWFNGVSGERGLGLYLPEGVMRDCLAGS